jgi:C4-dicarboxylate-binding protein DctP
MDSNHGVLDYMVIANAGWWDKLPADVRTALNKAMVESIKYGNKVAFDEDANYRKKVIDEKKGEVLPMSKAEQAQWREAMKPVWSKFEAEIGKDIIEASLAANKK